LHDANLETVGGEKVMCLGGFALADTARDACSAAGLPPDVQPDLEPIATWLRAGASYQMIVDTIRDSRGRPDRPNLRYFHNQVMAKVQKQE